MPKKRPAATTAPPVSPLLDTTHVYEYRQPDGSTLPLAVTRQGNLFTFTPLTGRWAGRPLWYAFWDRTGWDVVQQRAEEEAHAWLEREFSLRT